jgi:hypothetical protein
MINAILNAYLRRIERGEITLEEVPKSIQSEVEQLLKNSSLQN